MENVFFEGRDIRVTNSRFIVRNQTYAMAGITSVRAHEEPPNRLLPLLIIVVGVVLIFTAGLGYKLLGAAVVALGVFIWSKQRSIHVVLLCSASGEVRALSDAEDPTVDIPAVVTALNDAIIHRG